MLILDADNLEGEVWQEKYLLLIEGTETIRQIDNLEFVGADQVYVASALAGLRRNIDLEDNSAFASIGVLLAVALRDIILLRGACESLPEPDGSDFVVFDLDSFGVRSSVYRLAVRGVGMLRPVELTLQHNSREVLLNLPNLIDRNHFVDL